ncbi:hypothetical protein [Parafilimonas terrae]|nr:hypothetical protein [Parafilimonas terrae]
MKKIIVAAATTLIAFVSIAQAGNKPKSASCCDGSACCHPGSACCSTK